MNLQGLVITPGDPEGIGPEVTAKALNALKRRLKGTSITIVGSRGPFKKYLRHLSGIKTEFIEPPQSRSAGYQSAWAVQEATRRVSGNPNALALVTGPISKERIRSAGFKFNGHTDFLAHLTNTPKVTMMLANQGLRVALVTDHCPLKRVSSRITASALERTISHAARFCRDDLKVLRPRIAVLGLNPHAGEGGVLGSEEVKVIAPTLRRLSKKEPGIILNGPFPADSFFAKEASAPPKSRHDIVIALYHDQGLIPLKLTGFGKSMNMTLGLPIIRTSVDHGTAFDIAGKDQADPGSMIYAIENALKFLKNRRKR